MQETEGIDVESVFERFPHGVKIMLQVPSPGPNPSPRHPNPNPYPYPYPYYYHNPNLNLNRTLTLATQWLEAARLVHRMAVQVKADEKSRERTLRELSVIAMQSGARGRQTRCAFKQLLEKSRASIADRGGPDPNYERPPAAAADNESKPAPPPPRRMGQSVY